MGRGSRAGHDLLNCGCLQFSGTGRDELCCTIYYRVLADMLVLAFECNASGVRLGRCVHLDAMRDFDGMSAIFKGSST